MCPRTIEGTLIDLFREVDQRAFIAFVRISLSENCGAIRTECPLVTTIGMTVANFPDVRILTFLNVHTVSTTIIVHWSDLLTGGTFHDLLGVTILAVVVAVPFGQCPGMGGSRSTTGTDQRSADPLMMLI